MEIIEGYLAKNPIVMGSKESKYQRIKFKVKNINSIIWVLLKM